VINRLSNANVLDYAKASDSINGSGNRSSIIILGTSLNFNTTVPSVSESRVTNKAKTTIRDCNVSKDRIIFFDSDYLKNANLDDIRNDFSLVPNTDEILTSDVIFTSAINIELNFLYEVFNQASIVTSDGKTNPPKTGILRSHYESIQTITKYVRDNTYSFFKGSADFAEVDSKLDNVKIEEN